MDAEQRRRAFDAVDRATDLPMLVLSLLLVPIIVVPFLVTIPPGWVFAWESVGWVIWAAFALGLTVKTYLALRRTVPPSVARSSGGRSARPVRRGSALRAW